MSYFKSYSLASSEDDGAAAQSRLPNEILFESSFDDQIPTGLDTPLQIEFGSGAVSSDNSLILSPNGTFAVTKAGLYEFILIASVIRVASSGEALLFFRTTVNDAPISSPVSVSEDDNDSSTPLQFELNLDLSVGDVVKFEFYRDSIGSNSGKLAGIESSIGWGKSASASVRVLI